MRLTCFLLCWLTFSAVASVNAQQGIQREPVAGCGVPGFEVGGGVLFDTPSCLF